MVRGATNDISLALEKLDSLLTHVSVGGQRLSTSEFGRLDDDMVIVTNDEPDDKYQKEDDENAITIEKPPKLIEAIEMIRRLHLLATIQYPRLHSTVTLNSIHNVLKSTSTPKDLNTLQWTTISAKIENIVVFLK
jgi:hypothetical protein